MIKNLNTLFVTMFGLGKIPKIPGKFCKNTKNSKKINKKIRKKMFASYSVLSYCDP